MKKYTQLFSILIIFLGLCLGLYSYSYALETRKIQESQIVDTFTDLTVTNASTTLLSFTTAWGSLNGASTELTCTNCINATEIEDIYALTAGDSFTGDVTVDETLRIVGQSTLAQASSTMLTVSGDTYLATVQAGTWNGTAIDFSTYTNATAGTGITFTDDAISTNDSEIILSDLSGYVANGVIDWTTDQGATNIDAGNYTDTNTTPSDSTWTIHDSFPAACSASNFVSAIGDTLTCSVPTNTTYTGGTNLTLNGTEFDVDDAFIVNNASDTMTGTLTADGLTLGANENLTLGSQTLDHNGTDFVFNDSVNITGEMDSTATTTSAAFSLTNDCYCRISTSTTGMECGCY